MIDSAMMENLQSALTQDFYMLDHHVLQIVNKKTSECFLCKNGSIIYSTPAQQLGKVISQNLLSLSVFVTQIHYEMLVTCN